MTRSTILSVVVVATLFATSASAFTYRAFDHEGGKHGVWLPDTNYGHLVFDDGAMMTVDPDAWKLDATLTGSDGSRWAMTIDFTELLRGPQFGILTSYANGQLRGGVQLVEPEKKWGFAGTIRGRLTALDGELAGHIFSLSPTPRPADFRAQFGACPVDVNCDKQLSSWIDMTDKAPIDQNGGSNPVPEPSAALIFGLGTLVASSSIRRRVR